MKMNAYIVLLTSGTPTYNIYVQLEQISEYICAFTYAGVVYTFTRDRGGASC